MTAVRSPNQSGGFMKSKLKNILGFILLVGCLLSTGTFLNAQETATISGTVSDSSGAVVPNVRITIVRQSTGVVTRSMKTNAAGIYIAPDLATGNYNVRAEAPGFAPFERDGIVLNVSSTVQTDIRLAVGSQAQEVIVEANPVEIQKETSDLSTLINSRQIDEIDTNGRSIFQLTELVPGASSALPNFNNPVAENTTTTISFNGLSSGHNLYLLDGGEINDRGCSGCYAVTPSQNAISEVKVITGNAQADTGMASGGFIALSTKSGTHDFHGQAWEYNRNDLYDANDYFAKQSGTAKPKLRYNIFGFNVGGPVVIPHVYGLQRDKTFFFFNMEWRRLIQGNQIFTTGIPGSEFKGNFGSNTITVPQTLDPAAIARFAAIGLAPGQQFPNNQIPSSLIDPNVSLLLKSGIFPAANTPDGVHYSAAPPSVTNMREEVGRIDHRINDKFSLMTSFIYDSAELTSVPPGYGATYPTDGSLTNTPSYALMVHLVDTINTSLVNETAFNYSGNQIKVTPTGNYSLPTGYNASSYYKGANTDNRIPDIILGQPYGVEYTVGSNPWYNELNVFEFKDDLSWAHGRHNFRTGGSAMFIRKYQQFYGSTQGTYNFDGTFTGNSFADFLLGYSQGYSQLQSQAFVDTAAHSLAFYGLDNWRVNNRLTLNLGLRWEYLPHTYEINNRLANFNAATYNRAQAPIFNPDGSMDAAGPGFSTVNGTLFYLNGIVNAGANGTPRSLVGTEHNNFEPRIGFAYQLDRTSSTVLRGGFGMFYERVAGGDTYNLGSNPPFSNTPSAANVYFSQASTSDVTGDRAALPLFPSSLSALNPYYPVPLAMQYSLGIQRQLSPVAVLTIGYAGTKAIHQEDNVDINTVPINDPNRLAICSGNCGYNGPAYNANLDRNYPGWASINNVVNVSNTTYNSLQAALSVTTKHGLNVSAAYTWAHAIDFGGGMDNPYDIGYDKGNSNMDRRQVVKLSYYYSLPFFKSSHSLLTRTTLAGWQISGITTMQTGLPVSASLGYDNTGLGGNETSRADQIAPLKYLKTADHWIDPSSFAAPAPLVFGNSARNVIYGPGLFNWDMALYKSFQLGREKGPRFELRGESFNVFNHTEFNSINNNFSNGPQQFGAPTSVYQPRLIQLGASLSF